jgi:putative transposase
VTIRYDPRDLSEIRVFHQNRFLCRAVSHEHAGRNVSLKDIETARTAYRRSLRTQIRERVEQVTDFLPAPETTPALLPAERGRKPRLRTYFDND